MTERHEILHLNRNRSYVKVGDTWYDTHIDLYPQVGANFLMGKIEQVLSYDDYTNQYPESKQEIYPEITDKTISGGYLRRVIDGVVEYAVNPATPQVGSRLERELLID
jgi:hypothetical protein